MDYCTTARQSFAYSLNVWLVLDIIKVWIIESRVISLTHCEQIEDIKQQIITQYAPQKIILFGSCAKGVIRRNSDIDLCIILETEDVRSLKQEMQLSLSADIPLDIVVYTPDQWEKHLQDPTSFARLIYTKGAVLYG